jgi:hypothetical protein
MFGSIHSDILHSVTIPLMVSSSLHHQGYLDTFCVEFFHDISSFLFTGVFEKVNTFILCCSAVVSPSPLMVILALQLITTVLPYFELDSSTLGYIIHIS